MKRQEQLCTRGLQIPALKFSESSQENIHGRVALVKLQAKYPKFSLKQTLSWDFPQNFAKFSEKAIFKNTSGRLPLKRKVL